MRILQISNKIPFKAKDGGSLAIYHLLKGFCENNIEVYILSMNTSKHKLNTNDIQKEIPKGVSFNQFNIDTSVNPVLLLLNLIFSRKPYILQRFVSKKFKNKIKNLIFKNHFDIIQLEGLYLCPYINVIKKNSKALISYRGHNVESSIWQNNAVYENNFIKKYYLRLLSKRLLRYEKSIINRYDLLVPISLNDLAFFNEHGNKKPYHIAPFGIYPELYPFNNSQIVKDKISLFYIGSLDWIPNIDGLKWFVLNVWGKIKKQFPEITLKVAGRNAVPSIIKLLKENKIEFLGEIDNSQPFFLDNTIMIVPLFSGSGMRVKIIEGMAYGKAVISTRKGAEGIQYADGENILIAESESDFIKHLNLLITKKEILYKIGKNARKLIECNYNNNNICNQLISFYKQQI